MLLRPRVIPCLQLRNNSLVKTCKFQNPRYIGDPINAVKIFNEKCVDELILLDITATTDKRSPNFSLLEQIASEAFMPLAYGGGVQTLEEIKKLLGLGFEKIVINSSAVNNPKLIDEASALTGCQSIVVSIDVKKNFWGKYRVVSECGRLETKLEPVEFARNMEQLGAGEIFLTAVDREGMMNGYDLELINKVAESVSVPVVANGGAANAGDFYEALRNGKASAVAAGSMFIFYGKHKAVLITVPDEKQLIEAGVYQE